MPSNFTRIGGAAGSTTLSNPIPRTTAYLAYSPSFDMYETDAAFIVEGEAPGLEDKSKFDIGFTENNNTLHVHRNIDKSFPSFNSAAWDGNESESKHKNKNGDGNGNGNPLVVGTEYRTEERKYWVEERIVREFHRDFPIPRAVDSNKIEARLDHGLLRIIMPKLEGERMGIRIEVR
ncbi:hypothetical protein RUND412_002069 [Rhizina undulata]